MMFTEPAVVHRLQCFGKPLQQDAARRRLSHRHRQADTETAPDAQRNESQAGIRLCLLAARQSAARQKRLACQFRLRRWRRYRFANHISPFAHIGPGLVIPHPADITIGGSAFIGSSATIFNSVTVADFDSSNCPMIGNNVTIYTGAKIIKEVTIGDNVIIGALTLINKSIPANRTVYGIPPNQKIVPK